MVQNPCLRVPNACRRHDAAALHGTAPLGHRARRASSLGGGAGRAAALGRRRDAAAASTSGRRARCVPLWLLVPIVLCF